MKTISYKFNEIMNTLKQYTDISKNFNIEFKEKYSNIEILYNIKYLKNDFIIKYKNNIYKNLITYYTNNKRIKLIENICFINNVFKKVGIKDHICHSGKKVDYMRKNINSNYIGQYPF